MIGDRWGVTVKARPEAVWPWVTQIQWAPYSYDWRRSRDGATPTTQSQAARGARSVVMRPHARVFTGPPLRDPSRSVASGYGTAFGTRRYGFRLRYSYPQGG